MEEFNEEDSKVKKLYDGSFELDQKLPDGSSQLTNVTKEGLVIENSEGVSSLDLEKGIFNLASLKNIDVTAAVREEVKTEGDLEIHRYLFADNSWADITFKNGAVLDVKTNNVGMIISEKGQKLTIIAPPENSVK